MFSKFIKIFFVISLLSTLAISFLAFYPGLPPNVSFTEFNVKPNLELVNELLVNQKLNFVERLFENRIHGPEAFAVYNDELYTTLANGDIIKVDKNDKMTKLVIRDDNTYSGPTRPLGITFDQADGTMYVCDAFRGIWMLKNQPNASVEYLVKAGDKIAGKEAKVFNALALAKNGDVFWSDSSSQFDLFDGIFDVLADGSGRLVKYDRRTKTNTVLIDKLHFANGVAILDDQDAVLVAETVMSRVHRYDLSSGKHTIFIDRLPGIPDNIQADGKGNFWVPLVLAGDENHPILFQFLGPYPNVRRYFARLFRFYELLAAKLNEFFPNPFFDNVIYYIGNFESMTFLRPKRLTIVRVTSEGKIKESLHSTNGKLHGISDAIVFNNHLYLGSPWNSYLGRVPLELLDLKTYS